MLMVAINFIQLVIMADSFITVTFPLLQVSIPSRADKLLEISGPKPTQYLVCICDLLYLPYAIICTSLSINIVSISANGVDL